MSSKEEKESENIIKCTNCRQDIEAKKMFLHEGFCLRNNVYCEHCEKVFLKSDYEKHKKKFFKEKKSKTIKNEKIKDNKESSKQASEKKEKEISAVIKESAPIEENPKPLQYPRIPIVEEYKINTPIIITENGQILSNKNKNEFLLPYLGIEPNQNNFNNTYSGYNVALNDETIMNLERQSVEDIKNMLYRNSQFNQNVIINNNFNAPLSENINNNNIDFYNINNQINNNNNINDVNNMNQDLYNNNNSNLNYTDYLITESLKEPKNNSFKLNKNIPEFNNKKVKLNNYKNDIYTPEKESKSQVTNDTSYKKSAKAPLDTNGKKKSNKKEPIDSKSKLDIRKKQSLALTKSKSNYNKNIRSGKKNELISYLKSSEKKNNNKNNDKDQIFDDNLMNQNIEEYGIEENQKEILHRNFIPLSHNISYNNNEKFNYRIPKKKQISSELVLQESQKSSIKKKLFPLNSNERNKKRLVMTEKRNNGKKIDLKVKLDPKGLNRYDEEIMNGYIK